MRNGIVYAVNDNPEFVEKLVNSANSFWHFNPALRDSTTLYVVTDAPNLQLSGLNPEIPTKLVVLGPEAYADCRTSFKRRYNKYNFYRLEMFHDKELLSLDNSLYLDVDTEFGGPIDELFVEGRKDPAIMLVKQSQNHLRNKKREPKFGDLMCENYYNSGFILLTPSLIGAESLGRMRSKMVELAETYDFETVDQDALNATLEMPEWKPLIHQLPKTYNFSWWTSPTCTRIEADAERNYKMKHHGGAVKYEKRFIYHV